MLRGWNSIGGSRQTSKLVTMTSEACDQADNPGYVTASTESAPSIFLLIYMFESLPGQTVHKTINGVNYTVSDAYTQYARGSSFNAKEIEGVTSVNGGFTKNTFAELALTGYTQPESTTEGIDKDDVNIYQILPYTRKKHTITLNLNDSDEINGETVNAQMSNLTTALGTSYTGSDSVYTLSNVMYGTHLSYIRPNGQPTREHCTFTGWYTDAECLQLYDFTQTMPDSNVTIYAGWVVNPVQVTYYLDDEASDVYDNETVPYGTEAPDIVDPTVNQLYGEFLGWYYKPFENINYTTQFIPGSTVLIGDTRVFAKWRSEDFTVTYVYNDGTPDKYLDPETYELHETMKLMEVGREYEGKIFIGWLEQGSSSERLRQPGDP